MANINQYIIRYIQNEISGISTTTGPTGSSFTGPNGSSFTGPTGSSFTGPTGVKGSSFTGPTGVKGSSFTGPTGPLNSSPTPAGTIIMGLYETPPPGYFLCNGEIKKPFEYPNLFNVIGYNFGSTTVQGTKCFALPDYSGMFLRGMGGYNNYKSASNYYTQQFDQILTHTHIIDGYGCNNAPSGGDVNTAYLAKDKYVYPTDITSTSQPTGGGENRPINYGVYYYISF